MEPLFHVILPLLILLAFFPRLNKDLVFKLLFLTIIMDFDIFIPNEHRMIFHNLLFVLVVVLIIYFLMGKVASLIGLYYLISHLILDLSKFGLAFLYPFYKNLIYLNFAIFRESGKFFAIDFEVKSIAATALPEFKISYYLTYGGSLILILLILIFIVKIVSKKLKKRSIQS